MLSVSDAMQFKSVEENFSKKYTFVVLMTYLKSMLHFSQFNRFDHQRELFLLMMICQQVKDDVMPHSHQPNAQALHKTPRLSSVDPVWQRVREEAENVLRQEPELSSLVLTGILNHDTLEAAVQHRVAVRLSHDVLSSDAIEQAFAAMVGADTHYGMALRADMMAVADRDPACTRLIEPLLFFKGFHALQTHRLAHWLWNHERVNLALYLQSRCSEVFQTDIHPAAQVGKGVFWDHATGIVIGSTAVIEDNVSILQGVTLGGTGKERGDRHPKIRHGVLIGAGAKILGNIEIGHCAKVAAGSVVLQPVPPCKTVAGVPAKIIGDAGCSEPARSMDQCLGTKTTDDSVTL
jgi:serine O-acetyltransferase